MVFSRDDRILIRELRECKGYGAKRLLKEFPLKNWSLAGLKRLIKSIALDCIKSIALERVYRVRIHDVDHLKRRLVEEWAQFDQTIIDVATKQWRQRLRACVSAEGGHFEHMM